MEELEALPLDHLLTPYRFAALIEIDPSAADPNLVGFESTLGGISIPEEVLDSLADPFNAPREYIAVFCRMFVGELAAARQIPIESLLGPVVARFEWDLVKSLCKLPAAAKGERERFVKEILGEGHAAFEAARQAWGRLHHAAKRRRRRAGNLGPHTARAFYFFARAFASHRSDTDEKEAISTVAEWARQHFAKVGIVRKRSTIARMMRRERAAVKEMKAEEAAQPRGDSLDPHELGRSQS